MSDTKQAVQLQIEISDQGRRGIVHTIYENKDADQQHRNHALICTFVFTYEKSRFAIDVAQITVIV